MRAESSFTRTYDPSAWRADQTLPWDLRFVQLTDLVPNSAYGLQCGVQTPHGHVLLQKEITHFESKPRLDAPFSGRWSFIAFGDLGVEAGNVEEGQVAVGHTRSRVLDEVVNQSAKFVIHYGDISYANGIDAIWDSFMDAVEPIASRVPWMISPGNHEVEPVASGNELGVPMFARFWMPQQCSGQPFWYSFDYGGVHFVSLSTEHEFGQGSAQLAFLRQDLARASGKYAFVVVVGHRPLVSSHSSAGKDHSNYSRLQFEAWQPIFEEYKVDLTLWGHVHAYERTVLGGVPHVTSGMAGQSFCCGSFDLDPPTWSWHREDSHGYLRIAVDLDQRPREMRVEYVRSVDGGVYDAFTLHSRADASVGVQHLGNVGQVLRGGNATRARGGSCVEEGKGEVASSLGAPPTVPPGLCPPPSGGVGPIF